MFRRYGHYRSGKVRLLHSSVWKGVLHRHYNDVAKSRVASASTAEYTNDERSLRAGADLILTTGSASWGLIHPWLVREARSSPAFRKRVRESAARVLGLKRGLAVR